MLKNIIHQALLKRHFWRHATFDELSEVYIAMLFRSFALGMIGIFVPVYILKLGYGLEGIMIFFACFFGARFFLDFAAAHTVARYGPKHTLLVGYIIQIAAAATFSLLESTAMPLFIPAIIWGGANSFTFIALHVDFSKIKHTDHGGKELGYLNALERIGGMIGPALGGVFATFFGAQTLFLVSTVVLILGLVPLFKTAEPVKTRQKLEFRKLQIAPMKWDLISGLFYYIENNLSLILWPAFLTLFVFTENIYGTIGGLASIGFMVSVIAAYIAGKVVDEKNGGILLRYATIANTIVYSIRPFVSGVVGVLGVNIMNEALTVAYRIPYTKGLYDAADQHPGLRIVYLTSMESFGSLGKCVLWLLLLILSGVATNYQILVIGFMIAGISSLLINTQRFSALKTR